MKWLWVFSAAQAVMWGQSAREAVRQGEQIFAKSCATGYCHGARGGPGGAPRLAGRGFTQPFIAATVARGVSGTAMPSFAGTLSRSDLAAVVAYVSTLNGIANPAVAANVGGAESNAGPALSANAAKGRQLFSDAVRGFGRCSTCHEVNGLGISVATPIAEIPANAQALRSLATPHVLTSIIGGEQMPSLPVSSTNRGVVFYDLTSSPPVLRTADQGSVTSKEGSPWSHSSAIGSYNDAELDAILEYLRAASVP
ncbi:MAG: c-type cytochrome [Bryobacterales bacterium]|nr:c-type cytochrome [Bryobacterales bacterium]MBV9396611.1 c-type cytochrome [Bryobacterales bacterium]